MANFPQSVSNEILTLARSGNYVTRIHMNSSSVFALDIATSPANARVFEGAWVHVDDTMNNGVVRFDCVDIQRHEKPSVVRSFANLIVHLIN